MSNSTSGSGIGARERKADVRRVVIEDVNLAATPYPIAHGRDPVAYGVVDIDLSHAPGDKVRIPAVGEVWYVRRPQGTQWVLAWRYDKDAAVGGGHPDAFYKEDSPVSISDDDFPVPPPNGTLAVTFDTGSLAKHLWAKAGGAWVSVALS